MAVVEDQRRFLSPNSLCERRGITPNTLRHWLAHRDENGMDRCCLKIGKLVVIDEQQFIEWLESHREVKSDD